VFSYERLDKSPKKIPQYFDHVAKVEARDSHTVVFRFKDYLRRVGLPLRLGLLLRDHAEGVAAIDAKDWKNAVGTGPFQIVEYVTAIRRPTRRTRTTGTARSSAAAPTSCLRRQVVYRIIKDEATQHTALRTPDRHPRDCALDRGGRAEEERAAAQVVERLSSGGSFLAMRVDQKPFDDIRVRRALNMAVNKQEIVKSYYGGNAELFAYPMHPDYFGYYEPLRRCRLR
jgi:peptide/nickel transport system substrate-binding protein